MCGVVLQELVRRWEQYVSDTELYENARQDCTAWQTDVLQRLAACTSDTGDKYAIHNKLSKLEELAAMRDEGYQKLQTVIDQSQLILPNTGPLGKEEIRNEVHQLQRTWDDIMVEMTGGKSQLEAAAAQWELYDDTTERLVRWLRETENITKVEFSFQSSLPEKRAQLDRIKVRHMLVTGERLQPSGQS